MKVNKQIATLVLTGVLVAGSALPAFAAAAPDGYTDASATPTASFRVATDAAITQLVQEQTITGQAAVKDSENTLQTAAGIFPRTLPRCIAFWVVRRYNV